MHQSLEARLNSREPVLLDGAMGTELVRRGVRWRKHGLLTDADRVQQLHEEYLAAGAEVIRTNTFQLNPRIYLNVFRNRQHMRHIGAPGLEDLTSKLLRTSVRVARQARANAGKEHQAAIAGVLAPLEHCFRPDLAPEFELARSEQLELARVFAEEKVDLLLGESLNTIAEARALAEVARAVGLPVWISFVIGPEGELLSREPLARAIREVEKLGAQAVLVNCAPPAEISRALAKVKAATRLPYGGFAHIGHFSPPSWKFEFFPQFSETETWPPERYTAEARRWRDEGATILGGCCGTTPAHIAALHAALGARREGAKSA
jgi:S-methylmethionine-dependent homocysteine/selenocysteine methylase